MLSCVVYGCTSNSITSDPSIKYHPFPKGELAQQWDEACGWHSNTLNHETARICSIHFDDTAYNSEIKMIHFVACYSKILRADAVPTLYLPQTHILIKDGSMELENGMVVYTLNSSTSNENITISLEDDTEEQQVFEVVPSTSNIKLETQTSSLKSETRNLKERYDNVKNYPDLYVLQAHNKSLKRKLEELEQELEVLHQNLAEKEDDFSNFDNACNDLDIQITNNAMFSQHEQKEVLSKVFSEAQIKVLFGKKKVYWTNDDMAVGYIIRHLSNKRCYNYLTKTLKIPLPGMSSIKRWVTAKKTKRIRN